MFLILLGGSLALGVSLFLAASITAGALISARTVPAIIGWLFVLATVGCLLGLRQSSLARLTAGAVTLCSGLLLVYMAHFEWTAIASVPSTYAYSDPKVIEAPTPALAAALGMKEIVIPDMPKGATPTKPVFAVASAPHLRAQPAACAALTGIESLQCARCSEKSGLALIVCRESARLEFCEGQHFADGTCPSPYPQSYPG
jgi:hypothetical protein